MIYCVLGGFVANAWDIFLHVNAHSVNGSACYHSMHFIKNSLCHNKLDGLKVVSSQTVYVRMCMCVCVAVMDCHSQVSTEKKRATFSFLPEIENVATRLGFVQGLCSS